MLVGFEGRTGNDEWRTIPAISNGTTNQYKHAERLFIGIILQPSEVEQH